MNGACCVSRCRACEASLATRELRWGLGLCNNCYNTVRPTGGYACKACHGKLSLGRKSAALQWGSGLCDSCYHSFDRQCRSCQGRIGLGQLRWGTGLCDQCYEIKRSLHNRARISATPDGGANGGASGGGGGSAPMSGAVRMVISAQLVFYLAPAVMLPSLYLHISEADWGGAGRGDEVYAAVLTTATVLSMATPVPLGLWAEARGEREVYAGITLVAAAAAVALAVASSAAAFATAWGMLGAPVSLRGVRAVFFARNVPAHDLSRVGQLASAAGLIGALAGPLISQLPLSFATSALLAAGLHAAACAGLYAFLPPLPRRRAAAAQHGSRVPAEHGSGGGEALTAVVGAHCERCERLLSWREHRWGNQLCDECWETWFRHHKRRTLLWCCGVAFLLELSINAGVLATFQPLAVRKFGWGGGHIATVNFLSAGASILVSLGSAHARLPEWKQAFAATALYLGAVLLGAWRRGLRAWRWGVAVSGRLGAE